MRVEVSPGELLALLTDIWGVSTGLLGLCFCFFLSLRGREVENKCSPDVVSLSRVSDAFYDP